MGRGGGEGRDRRLAVRQIVGHAKPFQHFVPIGFVDRAHHQIIEVHIDTNTQG